MSKKALGRGLNTLLPQRSYQAPVESAPAIAPLDVPVTHLPIAEIVPNPFQPRKRFDLAALNELAQSIRTDGVIQPLVVRKTGPQLHELIAGERRWRASQIAGLTHVPVRILDLPDERMLEVALVENIQREDLNPIEAAQAFQKLSEELGLSHEEIGQRTGKDRATISNFIRLLQLPADIQTFVSEAKLTPGHARALLKLPNADQMRSFALRAIKEQWSVREIEHHTTALVNPQKLPPKPAPPVDPNVRVAIEELERALGTRVRIVEKAKGKGRVEIDYFSADDLDRIYAAIIHET